MQSMGNEFQGRWGEKIQQLSAPQTHTHEYGHIVSSTHTQVQQNKTNKWCEINNSKEKPICKTLMFIMGFDLTNNRRIQ